MTHPGKRAFLAQLRTELDREHFEERAAIFEFDAGLPRADAERMARAAVRDNPMPVESPSSTHSLGTVPGLIMVKPVKPSGVVQQPGLFGRALDGRDRQG